jgi:hypothetical protein
VRVDDCNVAACACNTNLEGKLKMSYKTRYELVDRIYEGATAALVAAVAKQKLFRGLYSEPIKEAAWNLAKAFKAGAVFEDNYLWVVDKKADDAITALVDALVGENAAVGPYSDDVYWAVAKFVYAYRASQEMENCRITDHDEYEAEVERRRQIGLTIDPAIAETMYWYADVGDPSQNVQSSSRISHVYTGANEMMNIEQIKTAMEELESEGLLRRTGEMRWSERYGEWAPVYALTELGRAWHQANRDDAFGQDTTENFDTPSGAKISHRPTLH